MTALGYIIQGLKWLGFKGVLALFFFAWAGFASWQVNGLKASNTRLIKSLNDANTMLKANETTMKQNKADYEALGASCEARIKATTANLLAAKPQCPNGQKPVYNVKDLVKP